MILNTIDCKKITTVTVKDPDTKQLVKVVMVKLETGGIMGIDASFLATNQPVYSAFDKGIKLSVND